MTEKLSHIDDRGAANMVDVSAKPRVRRTATAAGRIALAPATIKLIADGMLKKGDCLAAARIAGISAAKKTADLIPLCHNIAIDSIRVDFHTVADSIEITAKAICTDKTGIEMEALTAVAASALTIYDMCKAVDKKMKIENIHLVEKTKDEL